MRLWFLAMTFLFSVLAQASHSGVLSQKTEFYLPDTKGAQSAKLELELIEVNSLSELAEAIRYTESRLRAESVGISAGVIDPLGSDSERFAIQSVLKQVRADHVLQAELSSVKTAQKDLERAKRINLYLTISRFVFNSSAISTAFMISNVPAGPSMMIGALIGAMSASIQWNSDWFNKFTKNAYFLVQQYRFLVGNDSKDYSDLSLIEKMLSALVERPLRMLAIESVFTGVVRLAMTAASIPISKSYTEVVATGWVSGGLFGIGVTSLSTQLEKDYPHLAGRIKIGRDLSFFAASILGNLASVLNASGVSIGETGLWIIGGTGASFIAASQYRLVAKAGGIVKDKVLRIGRSQGFGLPMCSRVYAY